MASLAREAGKAALCLRGKNSGVRSITRRVVVGTTTTGRRTMSSAKPEEEEEKSFMTDRSLLYRTSAESEYELGKHRSNALELIMKQPVIEVEGDVAVCDGGGGALGHPIEYIKVKTQEMKPVSCAYCGLRYTTKKH